MPNINPEQLKKLIESQQEELCRKLGVKEQAFVLFCRATNMPYVCCDPDSCNDQVWMFTDEELAKKTAMDEKDRQLLVIKLEKGQLLPFTASLYPMGVNEVLKNRGENSEAFALEDLMRKPDYSKLPQDKQPVWNTELLLTSVYFAQERMLPREKIDVAALRDLEEEMLVNLRRGRLLFPVQVPEGSGPKVQIKDMKLPVLKLPNGASFQPVCTDPNEFQKFNVKKNFQAITVDYDRLKGLLNQESKGILLNPTSVRIAVPREKLI